MRTDNGVAEIKRVPVRDCDFWSSRSWDAPTRNQRKTERAAKETSVSGDWSSAFNALLRRHVWNVRSKTAQVLLTLENLSQKSQYNRAMNTFFSSLFDYDVVPIVNENDTVAIEELRFGDNDTLSAHVASLISAEYLFLFTDVDGLYSSNPMKDPNAKRIQVVDDINKLMSEVDVASGAGSAGGTGGMVTKLTAARCLRCWV